MTGASDIVCAPYKHGTTSHSRILNVSVCSPEYQRGLRELSLHLSSKAGREHGTRVAIERAIHEELLDPLCVQTTALTWCASGGLHAKRTASAEVVVVEGNRS